MRLLTWLIIRLFVRFPGTFPEDEPAFSQGSGDMGPFLLEQVHRCGGRERSSDKLPLISGDWRHAVDQHGVILQLPADRFAALLAFLEQAFGPPSQWPHENTEGGKSGWYASDELGFPLIFEHDLKRTQVIVVKPQTPSSVSKRLIGAWWHRATGWLG
jgi:hypothetical protein